MTWEAEQAFCLATGAARGLNGEGVRVTVLHGEESKEWLFVERVEGGFFVSLVTVDGFTGGLVKPSAKWVPFGPVEGDSETWGLEPESEFFGQR